jgi:hypothetical protein
MRLANRKLLDTVAIAYYPPTFSEDVPLNNVMTFERISLGQINVQTSRAILSIPAKKLSNDARIFRFS